VIVGRGGGGEKSGEGSKKSFSPGRPDRISRGEQDKRGAGGGNVPKSRTVIQTYKIPNKTTEIGGIIDIGEERPTVEKCPKNAQKEKGRTWGGIRKAFPGGTAKVKRNLTLRGGQPTPGESNKRNLGGIEKNASKGSIWNKG